MNNEENGLTSKNRSLFPLTADDIVDNALESLDESQARKVTEKVAEEIVRMSVEKRKAEHRSALAQNEMKTLISNANLLDKSVSDYKINSSFETASGVTTVEIQKSGSRNLYLIAFACVLILGVIALYFLFK